MTRMQRIGPMHVAAAKPLTPDACLTTEIAVDLTPGSPGTRSRRRDRSSGTTAFAKPTRVPTPPSHAPEPLTYDCALPRIDIRYEERQFRIGCR